MLNIQIRRQSKLAETRSRPLSSTRWKQKQYLRWRVHAIPAYEYLQTFEDDEKVLGYVDPIKINAIIPLILPPCIKFNISSAMTKLLYMEGVFCGVFCK